MNKWFLLIVLQCCTLLQASQHLSIEEKQQTLDKSILDVARKNKLKSMYVDLLVIADSKDLEAAQCLIRK